MSGYICPVCGYPELEDEPREADTGASDEICPSCGFQFGWSDDDQGYTYETYRAEWVAGGMRWNSVGTPAPANWDPVAQLARVQSAN